VKQRPRPLDKKLELATYAHDKTIAYMGRGGDDPPTIHIPVPIAFRLYHLGRAYDLARIVGLHPTGSLLVDYVNSQTLLMELELLDSIVDDPVLHHYVDELLRLLIYVRQDTKRSILVKET
jgi:hypothetical protein